MWQVNTIIASELIFASSGIILGIVYFFLIDSARSRIIRLLMIPVTIMFLSAVVWGNVYVKMAASLSDDVIAANPQQAINNLTQALRVDPGSSSAYLKRGTAYLKANSAQPAYSDLEQAAALSPSTNDITLQRLAQASAQLGNITKALNILNALLADHPTDFYALNARGLIEMAEREYPAAIRDLEAALAVADDDTKRWKAHHNLGMALEGVHRFDDAISNLEAARQLRPNDAETLAQLANAYGQKTLLSNRSDRTGLHQEALVLADRALEIDPNDPAHLAHVTRCAALFYLGQREQAVKELSDVIVKDPYDSELFVIRAGMYTEMGQPDLAHRDLVQSQILLSSGESWLSRHRNDVIDPNKLW